MTQPAEPAALDPEPLFCVYSGPGARARALSCCALVSKLRGYPRRSQDLAGKPIPDGFWVLAHDEPRPDRRAERWAFPAPAAAELGPGCVLDDAERAELAAELSAAAPLPADWSQEP